MVSESNSYYLPKISTARKLPAVTSFLSLSSQRLHTSTSLLSFVVNPDSFQTWPFSAVFFCHSWVSLICLICFSLFYILHRCALTLIWVGWFSTLSKMSGFLWHSTRWAHQFGLFLQFVSGLECWHVALTPTLTMWLQYSNCTLPWITK